MKSVVKIYDKGPSQSKQISSWLKESTAALFMKEVEILHKKSNIKSYNKTDTDFSFGWHKDSSTLKSDIHQGHIHQPRW